MLVFLWICTVVLRALSEFFKLHKSHIRIPIVEIQMLAKYHLILRCAPFSFAGCPTGVKMTPAAMHYARNSHCTCSCNMYNAHATSTWQCMTCALPLCSNDDDRNVVYKWKSIRVVITWFGGSLLHRDLTQRRWMSYLEGQNQLLDSPSLRQIPVVCCWSFSVNLCETVKCVRLAL
jgi:hypothetical protein